MSMKRLATFVTATIRGGFFVVLPVVLVLFFIGEAVRTLSEILESVVAWLPVRDVGGVEVQQLLALGLVLAICFVAGVAVAAPLGARAVRRVEDAVLRRLPGYAMLKSLTQRLGGVAEGSEFAPALARVHGPEAWSPCFVIEGGGGGGGAYTVFVPLTPTPSVGFVYRVEPDALRLLDASMGPVVNCVMQWGSGLAELHGRGMGPR
jgi:uncharacterized membrane protein